MEACLASRAPSASGGPSEATRGIARTVTTTAAPAAPPAVRLAPPDVEASPRRRAAVWTLRGSALALLASSAVFGALAWEARQDALGTSLQREALEANDRYRTRTALTWTFAAAGVACAVASYIVGRQR
jgi:hypothetical protein